jgi:hypothetical protein
MNDTQLELVKILEQNIIIPEVVDRKDLAEHVSECFRDMYPLLSPDLYKIKREIELIPRDKKTIIAAFYNDVQIRDGRPLTHDLPGVRANIPLIICAGYGSKKIDLPINAGPKINYEIKCIGISNRDSKGKLIDGDRFVHKEDRWDYTIHNNNGYQEIEIKGTWTYYGKVESCTVTVPKVPETIMDMATEAQAHYFELLRNAKEKKFRGQVLEQPELHILWIPSENDFDLKIERKQIVSPDPALVLRINGRYDHVVGLWNSETDDVLLESLISRKQYCKPLKA